MAIRDHFWTASDTDVANSIESEHCPECGGSVTREIIERVCEECGLVIDEDRLDRGPEWRHYDADTCERTGAPLTPTRHDRGLSTEIGRGRDANGTPLSGKKRRRLARMRREHTRGRWQSKAERNLAHGLGEVQRIASAVELSESIGEQACALFRRAQAEDLLQGRSIEAMAAASVYGACRCADLSCRLAAVSDRARVEQSRVKNAYTTLNTELELPTQPMTPRMFIPQLASELDVSDGIQHRAGDLAATAEETGITTGVQPSGFAAACLYKAGREHDQPLTQAEVATAANTSRQTLRTHRDALEEHSLVTSGS